MGRDTLKECIGDYLRTLMGEVAYDYIYDDDEKCEGYINDYAERIIGFIEETCEITLDIPTYL
jgi:hypothetical protein